MASGRGISKEAFFSYLRIVQIGVMKPTILVGGQAVIEGVMIRVPGAYATAVRDPAGKIRVERRRYTSITERSAFWKRPVLRGMAGLFEALKLGLRTLQWSAEVAMPADDSREPPGRLANFLSTLVAIGLAIGLFLVGPLWTTTRLLDIEQEALTFNLVSGLFRIAFFLLYLVVISGIRGVRRVFQYHGAEHRVVYNFESGREITVANAQSFPTQHPRCGTSFMFIVLLMAILVFALLDTLVLASIGRISLGLRLVLHLLWIPLVAGLSYEVIKLTARRDSNPFYKALRAPGLWLQRITTRPPENNMVEVAIEALEKAFGLRYPEVVGKQYIAEAIG